jgi:hypothetical protein
MAKDKATPPRLIEKWMKRWASLDFRPKKELTGCPQCGSKLRPFVEPGCLRRSSQMAREEKEIERER